MSDTGKMSTAVVTGKYADLVFPDGPYATEVRGIVQACHHRIDLVKRNILEEARTVTDEVKKSARDWAQRMLDPESVPRVISVNRSPIEAKFTILAMQVADLSLGKQIKWPVSVVCLASMCF